MQKNNKLGFIIAPLILISVLWISVGYAALNTELNISGEAVVRTANDLYISNIEIVEMQNATETYAPSFTNDTTSLNVNVPTDTSTFTYNITIKNATNNYYYLSEIIEELYNGTGIYLIKDLYLFQEFEPYSETLFQIEYIPAGIPTNPEFVLDLKYVFTYGERYKDPVLDGADPELIDGLIPIVYDETQSVWKKADVLRDQWYDYSELQWANATSVIASQKQRYVDAEPGEIVEMQHMTSMMVWIPRYSYTIRDDLGYHGFGASPLSRETPGAIDIKFIGTDKLDTGSAEYTGLNPTNYFTSSAFCWGNSCDDPATRANAENKEIPGFWIAKFEASSHSGLLYSKPNQTPAANLTIANTFYLVQELMNGINGYNNYGYIGYVDAHLIKNTEWGAIAYLSQSEYGKYANVDYTGINKEIYLNNCGIYVTGIGGSDPHQGKTNTTCYSLNHTYESYNGKGASTTGNIYGVYDMVGGTFDRVMGVNLGPNGQFIPDSSGFTELPENKYINIYPHGTYTQGDISPIKGDGLTETLLYYSDRYLGDPRFSSTNYYQYHWFYRGGSLFFSNTEANGIFSYTLFSGTSDPHHASRFTITIY